MKRILSCHAYESGYTLTELLVVLAIMGLIVALAPPLLQSDKSMLKEKSAAYLLAARLTTAHDEAVDTQTEIRIKISPGQIIRFFPDGSASGGSIAEDRFVVSVSPISGQVSVDE